MNLIYPLFILIASKYAYSWNHTLENGISKNECIDNGGREEKKENHWICCWHTDYHVCRCDAGYKLNGTDCIEKTGCADNGVENTCKEKGAHWICEDDSSYDEKYRCICETGYKNIEENCVEPNPCAENTCSPGKICIAKSETEYDCICPDGFIGDNCTVKDVCYNRTLCYNGGICENTLNNKYRCICQEPFKGANCKDLCDAKSCNFNGKCADKENSANCTCNEGYYGDHCEYKDICNIKVWCQNGGTCENSLNYKFKCTCPEPFKGPTCQDLCDSKTCNFNGKCVNKVTSNKCNCFEGYSGENCDFKDACYNKELCYNGGTCQSTSNNKFKCLCPESFKGPLCKDRCDSRTCNNHGVCIDKENSDKCICTEDYFGDQCEYRNACYGETLCLNGGTCFPVEEGRFKCICSEPYEGINCERVTETSTYTETTKMDTTIISGPSLLTSDISIMESTLLSSESSSTQLISDITPMPSESPDTLPTFNITTMDSTFISSETSSLQSTSDITSMPSESSDTLPTSDNSTMNSTFTPSEIPSSLLSTESIISFTTSKPQKREKCDCGKNSYSCKVNEQDMNICSCYLGYIQVKDTCSECHCGENALTCYFDDNEEKKCICQPGYDQKNETCSAICRSDNECLNGGKCQYEKNNYFCNCKKHFRGDYCEINTICESLNQTCKSMGAECVYFDWLEKAICECPRQKVYNKELKICEDICNLDKCVHGECEIVDYHYVCRCESGYGGPRCDIIISKNLNNNGFLVMVCLILSSVSIFLILSLIFYIFSQRLRKELKMT